MSTYKARPTTYRGIEMRSRLEATVAANLDRWGYDWQYEPRAYGSRDHQYLPDFEIRVGGRLALVIEVKGNYVDEGPQFERMAAVWESDKSPYLALIESAWIRGGGSRSEGGPRASFLVKAHGLAPALIGAFALCDCGVVGLRFVLPGQVHGACRGCGKAGVAVAFLDPTEYRA